MPRSDATEAVKWYRLAADQGDDMAQFNLGTMYENGRGVSQNYVEAAKWFLKAANQGNVDAQFNLGRLYGLGDGVPQNVVVGHMWLNLSAVKGDPTASKLRDALARLMTPAQIAEAQKLAREWKLTK